jgi:DNA repair protein RecO (recombination protein O)
MTSKQELHLAYVLHSRAFRETSLLLEVISSEHGRVSIVARGVKRGKAKTSSLLQPFVPLHLSWYGNGELVTLTEVEVYAPAHNLQARNAICGLYLNELLVKLLPKWDPCAKLFNSYSAALLELGQDNCIEQIVLRNFEMQLLESLGYALQLDKEIETGAAIQPDSYYLFDPVLGPKLAYIQNATAIKGTSILALAARQFDDPGSLLEIKRLMRMVFNHHLGNRQIKTRELL